MRTCTEQALSISWSVSKFFTCLPKKNGSIIELDNALIIMIREFSGFWS